MYVGTPIYIYIVYYMQQTSVWLPRLAPAPHDTMRIIPYTHTNTIYVMAATGGNVTAVNGY